MPLWFRPVGTLAAVGGTPTGRLAGCEAGPEAGPAWGGSSEDEGDPPDPSGASARQASKTSGQMTQGALLFTPDAVSMRVTFYNPAEEPDQKRSACAEGASLLSRRSMSGRVRGGRLTQEVLRARSFLAAPAPVGAGPGAVGAAVIGLALIGSLLVLLGCGREPCEEVETCCSRTARAFARLPATSSGAFACEPLPEDPRESDCEARIDSARQALESRELTVPDACLD